MKERSVLSVIIRVKDNKMTEEKTFNIDPSWKGFYKTGGFSLAAGGVLLFMFVLSKIITQQPLVLTPEAALTNPIPPIISFLIAVIGEVLLMFGVLGLYFSLKDISKTNMLIATGFGLLAVPMFLASRGQIISLLSISSQYLATNSETLRAVYIASATFALARENTYATMAMVLLNIAVIIIGFTMLKGVFGKGIGYLGIIAGIITIFAPPLAIMGAPIIIPITGLVLSGIWNIVAGVKLYKLGKEV